MDQREKQSNLEFIAQVRKQRPEPNPTFAATLRRDLLCQAQAPRQNFVLAWSARFVGTALIVLLLVCLTTLAIYPPTRSWAQEIITDVLQSLHITHEPSHVERVWESFEQDPHFPTDEELPNKLTIEEAQSAVDFSLRLPTFIPDGYEFFAAYVHPDSIYQGADPQVSIYYQRPGWRSFYLTQMHIVAPVEFPIGEGTAQEVTVNGQPAIAVEKMIGSVVFSLSEQGDEILEAEKLHSNGLLWEDGDIIYQLWSNSLTLEEIIQIAESVE